MISEYVLMGTVMLLMTGAIIAIVVVGTVKK